MLFCVLCFEVRTSYLPEEISWAERLHPLLTYERDNGRYVIDYGQFHRTVPVTMPDCSAADWASSRHQLPFQTRKFNAKQSKTDDEDDDTDDYSVSFTFHSPEIVPTSTPRPVWNLFTRNRQFRDNGATSSLENSLRHENKGSLTWSVQSDVTHDRISTVGAEFTHF